MYKRQGRDYTVRFTDVMLFPQGYAAVLTQTELLDEPSVIVADIGGWTVDLLSLIHIYVLHGLLGPHHPNRYQ